MSAHPIMNELIRHFPFEPIKGDRRGPGGRRGGGGGGPPATARPLPAVNAAAAAEATADVLVDVASGSFGDAADYDAEARLATLKFLLEDERCGGGSGHVRVDANAPGGGRRTALRAAVVCGRVANVKYLLSRGAAARDEDVGRACSKCDKELLLLLLEARRKQAEQQEAEQQAAEGPGEGCVEEDAPGELRETEHVVNRALRVRRRRHRVVPGVPPLGARGRRGRGVRRGRSRRRRRTSTAATTAATATTTTTTG